MARTRICVDTDICIGFLRAREPGLSLLSHSLRDHTLALTAVTAFELFLGHAKMRRKDPIDDFIAQFSILPFSLGAARHAALIQAALDRKGEGIGMGDILIAGTCIAHNVPLLTMNQRHFARIDKLALVTVRP